VIPRVQRREALVQRPPFGGSLPLPLILEIKGYSIPFSWARTLAVGCEAFHSAFRGSGLPVEGIGVYIKKKKKITAPFRKESLERNPIP
jgi:hypothetical protein